MPSLHTLPFQNTELDIAHTVTSGQSFRWQRDDEGFWACLLTSTGPAGERDSVLIRLRHDGETIQADISTGAEHAAVEAIVANYFRLDINVGELSRQFSEADAGIVQALANFQGLRVLRQDPVECLIGFICSSAAPLHRIRKSVTGLCAQYGEPFPGGPVAGLTHYAFPKLERLAEASVADMMRLGLGYRARYVQGTAQAVLARGGPEWLFSLRAAPYADAKTALLELPGVGAKIADCVCLFSLDKDEAIPVDTHIWKIACRGYVDMGARALAPATYNIIGDALRARFGPMAGWAQQYLFYQDLFEKGAWGAYIEKVAGNGGI